MTLDFWNLTSPILGILGFRKLLRVPEGGNFGEEETQFFIFLEFCSCKTTQKSGKTETFVGQFQPKVLSRDEDQGWILDFE